MIVCAVSSSAATFVVKITADTFHGSCSSANCTLKDAIFAAETNGPGLDDIILQECATYTVTTLYSSTSNAFPKITTAIHIIGGGATIQRLSTAPLFRFFEVAPHGELTIENLTLRDGKVTGDGGAILNFSKLIVLNSILENNSGYRGGAILSESSQYPNQGPLKIYIDGSTLRNNSAQYGGALMSLVPGPTGDVITESITRSSIVNNHATVGFGGGMFVQFAHNLAILDTTVSGNTAVQGGGGIHFANPADHDSNGVMLNILLRNLTIVNNNASQNGGGINYQICGGATCPIPAVVPLTNCVVANNTAASNANYWVNMGNKLISGGNNIIGPGNGLFSSLPSDQLLSGTLANIGPLTTDGDAGGEHHNLLPNSIAINAAAACSANDQLGLSRVASCDIGAVEFRTCDVHPGGLVGWWRLGETVGNTAHDSAGFPNHGVWVNGPTPSPGMVNGALQFNGINQLVRVSNQPEIDFQGDCSNDVAEAFTIDAWVKTCATGLQVILDKRQFASNFIKGYSLYINNGRLGFQMALGSGNANCGSSGSACRNYLAPTSSPNLSDNRWHFVAITVSRCRGAQGKMYVDGNLVYTFTPLVGGVFNNADLLIGGGYVNATQTKSFHGYLDEVELYKSILTASEIHALYDAGWAGKC